MPINHLHLRAFHAVASTGSFTAAAAALHISQPTLSEQVKALETTYRVTLFSRRGRNVALTPLGHELLELTRRQADLDRDLDECLRDARDLTHAQLRLGADAPLHAMPLLAEVSRVHPGIDLSLACGNATEVFAQVLEHRVDAALVADAPTDPRVVARPLVRERFVAFVGRDDPLAGRRRVRLDDLTARRLVLREPGSRSRATLEHALAVRGLRPSAVIEADTREGTQTAVAMGLGVGVGVESELAADRRLVPIPLAGADLVTVENLVCLAGRRDSRLVGAVFAAAASVFGATRPRPRTGAAH